MALYILLRSWVYCLLLCSALWLNRKEPKMLALSALVGLNILLPIPYPSVYAPVLWYARCALPDTLLALGAYLLATRASAIVASLASAMVLTNLAGMIVGPSDGIGPYRIIIPALEAMALITCCLMSAFFIRNHKGNL